MRRLVSGIALGAALVFGGGLSALCQTTQPFVAVHDSEFTRALEGMNAVAPTPNGPGTTGKQWWPTDWHYFVMPESVKEALKSDGTAFTVVGDSNVVAGTLLNNGQPSYPIVISLASEAVRDDEIAQFTNYVASGGFLFVGSSAFTRNTNGTSRFDFAFGNQMGLHLVAPGLTNWAANNTFTKTNQPAHRLVSDIPAGQLTWRMPSYSDEIPWGISPSHPFLAPHDVWRVTSSGATVLAQGDSSPFLAVRQYGKGYFIYCSAFQPLIGHSGFAPSMYAYLILRRSIEWAFESANMPIPKLSPWPYQYDAAFMVRHDLENFTNEIAAIEASAQVEFTNGAKGDYYFCTGTLRDDASKAYNTNNIVAGLRRATTNYGATIGPHNGGLKNPNNASLVRGQYDYWHWGPDEALDVTPPGYPSGKAYATTSISNSFRDVESWLSGITNGLRSWVGCYFNATREDSYDLQAQLGVKIAGDQKLTPFPHWTVSTLTPNKRYPLLSEPVSDWFVGGLVAQSLEPWHPPGVQTTQTMHAGIDFYYNLGALINFYSHTLSTGLGDAGSLVPDYVGYCANTNLHPRMWAANGALIYQWWLQRSNAQVTASFSTNGSQTLMNFSIAGATHTNTTIEMVIPGTNPVCNVQVFTNGAQAGAAQYRVNGKVLKLRVGATITNATISYYPLGALSPVFTQNFDGVSAPALPSGWTTTASGVQTAWVTQTGVRDSAPNAAFSSDPSNIGVNELVSPPIAIPAGNSAQLTFRNNYDLETGPGTDGFDGGVLEIKIGTNAFTDILAAGGTFSGGGYNSVIDTGYSNPLAGRQAWSGNSGGFITTIVNLPAAALGQNIQLRWRCGTDDSNGASGWRIDTISIASQQCLCCSGPATNNPPVLPSQSDRTIVALTTLTVTNTASDPDVPPQTLSYQLLSPPSGATINASGIISWTPTAAQAPSTNAIITVVTDSGSPTLKATNSFNVVVTPANAAPVLPAQSNRTISESTPLTVTNTATDDGPAGGLNYVLLTGPAGAAVSSSGIITWTPTEAQGPSTNVVTTRVTDSGNPPLSATNSFTVTVTEVNSAPTLPVQSHRTIAELRTLVVTNTASDSDIPVNTLNYSLAGPVGAVISAAGVITWSPTEAQGPSTNIFTTTVSDNGSPPLSATNAFTVVVTEVNSAPVLPAQTNRSVIEATTLVVTNTATDSDIPANDLVYALINAPSGAAIDTNGIITWTPTPAQGPGTNVITTVVTDDGSPPLSATNSFTVFVIDTNTPPGIASQPLSTTNSAGTTATFTVVASGSALDYQWQKGTSPLSGATDSTLSLPSVSDSDAGGYSVIVSNAYGSVTSVVATLTVIDPPTILAQPVSRTNNAGTLATFSVTGGGTAPSYQWQKNGSSLSNGGNVSGATSSVLALSAVSGSDAGSYTVVLSNSAGGITSSVAMLTVISPPAITAQPAGRTNAAGTAATFTVVATGTSPTYQWIKNVTNSLVDGGNVSGSTSPTLTISNVAASDIGNYTVILTNAAGSVTSSIATLAVIDPPVIVTQPASRTNNTGTTATFTVVATGTTPTYQWRKNGTNNLVNGGNVSGANSATLSIGNVALTDAASYTVAITNLAGGVTSSPAILTVISTNPAGQLFADDFTRGTDPGPISPWIGQSGNWTVTGGALRTGTNTLSSYGYAYITNTFTNYTLQGQVRFQMNNAYGGGLGACLNRANGAHYGAWLYPEASPAGSNLLRLVKFQTWTTWGYQGASFTPVAQVRVGSVGTNWHTLSLTCSNNQIRISYDGAQMISTNDAEASPYLSGGISADMWTDARGYLMYFDNVTVTSLSGVQGQAILQSLVLSGEPPQIQSIAVKNGYATITWNASVGSIYRLQFRDDLNTGEWTDLQLDIVADGPIASATDKVGRAAQRFYRVVRLP